MSKIIDLNIDETYLNSIKTANSHYENFPVASLLIPRHLRKHIAVIYRFARQADDLADEGNYLAAIRTELLNKYESDLTFALRSTPVDAFWAALRNTIVELNIRTQYLYDLLKAFKQDVIKTRYENFDELLYYCKHSANPVGRIVLEIFNIRNVKMQEYSDSICTALQLTNFLQDTMIDFSRGRIYLPADEMKKFNISEDYLEQKYFNNDFRNLIETQVIRIEKMFDYGKEITSYLPRRLGYEIKWTIAGGKRILAKIRMNDYNIIRYRPRLSKKDYFSLLLKVILK